MDKKLSPIFPIQEKWDRNLPVNLKELAELQGVSYATAVRWSQSPNFPRVGRLLRREDFSQWWKKSAHPPTAAHRPPAGAGKSDAQPQTNDSPTAWPRKSERLLGAIASRS